MEFEIRSDRSSQGRKKLHAERAKFFELNTRPRKTLDWDTPTQRMASLLGAR